MEPVFLDAHKDLLLCVYYALQTKGTLAITYEDVQNFEKNFTDIYNKENNTNLNFVFKEKEIKHEMEENYEMLIGSNSIKPRTALKAQIMKELNTLDLSKQKIVNQMVSKTLSNYDIKQIIAMQKRKQMALAEMNADYNLLEKAL